MGMVFIIALEPSTDISSHLSFQPMMRRPVDSSAMMMSKLHQCEIHMKPKKRRNFLQNWLNKFPSRAKKIDVISRVVFPAIFAIFNLSYWCYYLLQEAQTET